MCFSSISGTCINCWHPPPSPLPTHVHVQSFSNHFLAAFGGVSEIQIISSLITNCNAKTKFKVVLKIGFVWLHVYPHPLLVSPLFQPYVFIIKSRTDLHVENKQIYNCCWHCSRFHRLSVHSRIKPAVWRNTCTINLRSTHPTHLIIMSKPYDLTFTCTLRMLKVGY